MTQPVQTFAPHEAVPGPCDSAACEAGNHVCTECGGGVTAYLHLPEARGDAAPQEAVEAGAAATVPVQAKDAAAGGEATR